LLANEIIARRIRMGRSIEKLRLASCKAPASFWWSRRDLNP
jgi:hypothetical protein